MLLKQDKKLAADLENQIREHYGFKKLDYKKEDTDLKSRKEK